VKLRLIGRVRLLRKRRESQQGVRHAAHRGHDDADTATGHGEHDARDAFETRGISEAAATELVKLPAILHETLPGRWGQSAE